MTVHETGDGVRRLTQLETSPEGLGLRRLRGAIATAAATAALGLATAAFESYRSRRAERLHPPLGRFLEIDGVRLHYLDTGPDAGSLDHAATPAVLLHGNGVMAEDFLISGVVGLAARRRRVVSFDRPGFGHSDRPRDRRWTAQAQADLIRKAFVRLGIERPVVAGHSWGTLAALALALEDPEAVAGLVLISGYYYPSLRVDSALFAPSAIPVIGDIIRFTVAPAIGRLIEPAVLRKSFRPCPVPERFKAEFPAALMVRPSQIRATTEDAAEMTRSAAELEPGYAALTMPVVILAGAEDAIVDMNKQAARLHGEIRGSELWVKTGVGHMLHYAAPDWVSDAIERVGGPSRERGDQAAAGALIRPGAL